MTSGRRVGGLAFIAVVLAIAAVCGAAFSAGAVARTGAIGLHVRVALADRYCLSGTGHALKLCPRKANGLIRLGRPSSQWLVIFSFTAPRSTVAHGRTYYYFTVDAPSGCPNAMQFAEYDAAVRKGQRVVQWTGFDKRCPGPGKGKISLVTARSPEHSPGQGVHRSIASFTFRIP